MSKRITIDEFWEAQPWLVYGVVYGISPLCEEKSFMEWLVSETNRRLKRRHPLEDIPQRCLKKTLDFYADDCVEKADQASAALRTLFEEVFLVDPLPSEVWDDLFARLSFLYWYGQAEEYLKFHLNSLFCLASGQECPTAPQLCSSGPTHLPGIFLGGAGYRMLRRFARQGVTWQTASLLLAKKGAPTSQIWKIFKTLSGHKKALTETKPSETLRDLEIEVIRTVDEIFPPHSKWGLWERYADGLNQPFRVPSCSGHVDSSREDLGAYAFIQDLIGGLLAEDGEYALIGLNRLFDQSLI